jgi:hypothetical protein
MKNRWFEWGLGAAAAVLLGTGLVVAGVSSRPVEAASAPSGPDPRLLVASYTSADHLHSASEMKRDSIKRNDTLSAVLDRLGAPREEANEVVHAASKLLDLRNMHPGDNVTAWLDTDANGGVRLMGLSLRPEVERQVLIARGVDGAWKTHELKTKLSSGFNLVSGDIET